MTNGEYLRSLTDEALAEWLCRQLWDDYDYVTTRDTIRYHMVRNFLKATYKGDGDLRQRGK